MDLTLYLNSSPVDHTKCPILEFYCFVVSISYCITSSWLFFLRVRMDLKGNSTDISIISAIQRNWDVGEFSVRVSVLSKTCRTFNRERTAKYFLIEVTTKNVCVLSSVYVMSTDNAMGSEAFSSLIASIYKKELIYYFKIVLILFFCFFLINFYFTYYFFLIG